jgi:hypothetical protein
MPRTDLSILVAKWQNVELASTKDLKAYARLTRQIGQEMYLDMHFHAHELDSRLRKYRGRWYTFGTTARIKARLVSARLKVGAEGFKVAGTAGTKMIAAFEKHFLELERQAKARKSKAKSGDFKIDDE